MAFFTSAKTHTIPVSLNFTSHMAFRRGLLPSGASITGIRDIYNHSRKIFSGTALRQSDIFTGNIGMVLPTTKQEDGSVSGFMVNLGLLGPSQDSKGLLSWARNWVTRHTEYKQSAHTRDIIEITSSKDPRKLLVQERRRIAHAAIDLDESTYKLTLNLEKALAEVSDPEKRAELSVLLQKPEYYITNVAITGDRVTLTYRLPADNEDRTVHISKSCFVDNFGKSLELTEENSFDPNFYQSNTYTPETEVYRPKFAYTLEGSLRLIVHLVDTYEIDKPEEIARRESEGELKPGEFKIHPSKANSQILVTYETPNGERGERWIPLNDYIKIPKRTGIDLDKSRVIDSDINVSVNTQNRIGDTSTLIYQVRDMYFYGMQQYNSFRTILRYGSVLGLNKAKGLFNRAIGSGRTMTEHISKEMTSHWKHPMETNNPYYSKTMQYGHEIMPPGVSEDHQSAIIREISADKMPCNNTPTSSLMSAEFDHGAVGNQQKNRYNLSEVLGYVMMELGVNDIGHSLLGDRPKFFTPGQYANTNALRWWYKWPYSETVKLLASPAFLLSGSLVPFLPVDQSLFITAWLATMSLSLYSYLKTWKSLSDMHTTGLFKTPVIERAFIPGYAKAAATQFYDRLQYAIFIMTNSGRGTGVPLEEKSFTNRMFNLSIAGTTYGAALLAANTFLLGWAIPPMFAFAIGINVFFCGIQALQLYGTKQHLQKADANITTHNPANPAAHTTVQITRKALGKGYVHKADLGNNDRETTLRFQQLVDAGFISHKAYKSNWTFTDGFADPSVFNGSFTSILNQADRAKILGIYNANAFSSLNPDMCGILLDSGYLEEVNGEYRFTDKFRSDFERGYSYYIFKAIEKVVTGKGVRGTDLTARSREVCMKAIGEFLKDKNISANDPDYLRYLEEGLIDRNGQITNKALLHALAQNGSDVPFIERHTIEMINRSMADRRALLEQITTAEQAMEALGNDKDHGTNLSYDQLFEYRERMRNVLISLGIMNRQGHLSFAKTNPYSMLAREFADWYEAIELLICVKAKDELDQGHDSQEPKMAVNRLLFEKPKFTTQQMIHLNPFKAQHRETRDIITKNVASRIFRKYGIIPSGGVE